AVSYAHTVPEHDDDIPDWLGAAAYVDDFELRRGGASSVQVGEGSLDGVEAGLLGGVAAQIESAPPFQSDAVRLYGVQVAGREGLLDAINLQRRGERPHALPFHTQVELLARQETRPVTRGNGDVRRVGQHRTGRCNDDE